MSEEPEIVRPGTSEKTVWSAQGRELKVPEDWTLVPPGDAALTRRIKTTGPCWLVQEKKGRRTFSRGLYAEAARVESIEADLLAERAKPEYAKKRAADSARRARAQEDYVQEFKREVLEFLAFPALHTELAQQLAERVTNHATPVGSGTVARTKRISVDRRAEAAVIAWMRHATTAYDEMHIARVKGRRREVRRMLAQRSKQVLASYRRGEEAVTDCPLKTALHSETDALPKVEA